MFSKKRIIFFPIETGLAHITRSLAIAEEAQKRGHQILFALSEKKHHLIKDKNIKVITVKEFFPDEESVEKAKDQQYISSFIPQELELLRQFKPEIAVNDLRLSSLVSCRILNIPTFFVTNTNGLPQKFHLPNPGLPNFIYKLMLPLIRSSIEGFKHQYLKSLTKVAKTFGSEINIQDLLDMRYIVPEIEEYLPLKNHYQNVNYVGPINWKGFEQVSAPSWLEKINPDGKTVYLTFGGTGYDGLKLVFLSELLVKKGYRVIVSSSNIIDEKAFPKLENRFVAKYLPGTEVCKRVDIVICHGGIGTMIQAIMAKKPVVAVPFNPDQYLHGLRFQELGLGKCITRMNFFDLFKLDWNLFKQKGKSISVEKIVELTDKLIVQKERFMENIELFKRKLPKIDGSKRAVDIIENI